MSKFHHQTPHVSHITLRVSSIEKSSLFYQNVIGLQVIEETTNKALLGNDTTSLLTLIPSTKPVQHSEGLFHIAFLLPSMQDLGKWFLFQRKSGFNVSGASNHLVSSAFYFNDPDGNGIEMYADTDPSTWEESKNEVRMDTRPLDIRSLVQGMDVPNILDINPIIGHLHLKTTNIRTQQAYYELLGFQTRFDMGSAVFMATKHYHHHIAFNQWNRNQMVPYNTQSVDIDQATIHYPNRQMIDQVCEQLTKQGEHITITQDGVTVIDPIGLTLHLKTN